MTKNPQTNNDKMCYFLQKSYLWRYKVLSYLHTAIKVSHLKAEVTRSLTGLMKTYHKWKKKLLLVRVGVSDWRTSSNQSGTIQKDLC